jgi:multisubunit Na+/H+ antiporter MnhG subunit
MTLMAGALGAVLVSSLGVLAARGPSNKLHYLGPASLVSPLLVACAWSCAGGGFSAAAKCWLTALALVLQSPILTYVAAHAYWTRHHRSAKTDTEERKP